MSYKFNVKPEDCYYIIDENKRKVVCLIENTKFMFLNFAKKNFKIPYYEVDWSKNPAKQLSNKLRMPNRFCGVATCSEEDEWDEETGKLIAYSRAKDKLNKSFFKRANLYISTLDKYLNDAVDMLNKLGARLEESTERRYNKISTILGDSDSNGVQDN